MTDVIEMEDLSQLRARLQFDYPNAPTGMLDDAIVCAAQELTARPLLQMNIDLSDQLQRCESDYSFADDIPEDLEMSGIISVDYCGCCLHNVDPKCNPCPHGWSLCDETTITLWPAVDGDTASQTLNICIALRPCEDACSLPSILVKRYGKILRDLARAELSNAPNQDWTDPRYAQFIGRKASGAMKRAQGRVSKDMTHNGFRKVKVRRWLM